MPHHPPFRKRLLIDGSPGATTLLLPAAHCAIPSFDVVLAADTGWFLDQSLDHLNVLRRIATGAGMDWVRAHTGDTARDSLNGVRVPLPLHTLTADNTYGRLAQGCARRQGVALRSAVRHQLGHPRPTPAPEGVAAECTTGTALDQAHAPPPAGPHYVRHRHPVVHIGWTSTDCRALLAHHEPPTDLDLACLACPMRSNRSWRYLRTTDRAAFAEAVAVDTALRHAHPDPAPHGMPPGTLFFLHPDRVPLDQADLSPNTGPQLSGCMPRACRSEGDGTWQTKGGNR